MEQPWSGAEQDAVPAWTRAIDRLIDQVASQARVIGICTPRNASTALAALTASLRAGAPKSPELVYEAPRGVDPRPTLDRAAEACEREGTLGRCYAARLRELSLEIALCERAGKPGFASLAAQRYARRDAHDDEADRLCDEWLESEPSASDRGPTVVSDDEDDPRSLVFRLRQEVGARRLPVRVTVAKGLASLAATGPGVIYVARGTRLTVRDVERTTLHEVEGHAMPRWRAEQAALGLFGRGTAGGSDEQEGRALCIEEREGFLAGARRRELARRHLAGRSVRDGANLVETAEQLLAVGAEAEDAARIALRAHRGGGLARELVYVPAWLRVRAALRADPSLERVLRSGQVSVAAAACLRSFVPAAS